ncbi:hypothetical protein [Actinacidiphila alni]|uniref:hypothetical protein n=1 Tax=Actinacidiphila alni TaxID=380248 RepID=UPI000B807E02|nr:hypothetical protein [Actinacidiphila alni]
MPDRDQPRLALVRTAQYVEAAVVEDRTVLVDLHQRRTAVRRLTAEQSLTTARLVFLVCQINAAPFRSGVAAAVLLR